MGLTSLAHLSGRQVGMQDLDLSIPERWSEFRARWKALPSRTRWHARRLVITGQPADGDPELAALIPAYIYRLVLPLAVVWGIAFTIVVTLLDLSIREGRPYDMFFVMIPFALLCGWLDHAARANREYVEKWESGLERGWDLRPTRRSN